MNEAMPFDPKQALRVFLKKERGWSGTTQPRSGIFRQALRLLDNDRRTQ
jgi:hypothetical protein